MAFLRLIGALCVLSLLLSGCEDPAATTTLEVTVEGVSPRDVARGSLGAVVGLTGECTTGPCDPNPCQGVQSRCIGQNTVHRCECPAGTSPDGEGMCVADEECTPSFCGGNGICEEQEVGEETVPSCLCEEGFIGANCDACDNDAGFFEDGFGGCTDSFEICRVGQGGEAFAEFLEEAEAELGHPPNELELVSVTLERVEETTTGVRNWAYLWSNDLELSMSPGDGNPIRAATAAIPEADQGLPTLDFDILIDRPTFSRNPEFFEGNFAVELRGATERVGSEPFGLDLILKMEFNAY